MSRENHMHCLQAALRVSRGWIIPCSAQARRDLKTVDEALAMTSTDAPPSTPVQSAASTFHETGDSWKVEFVAGPAWREAEEEDECWTAEIQTIGGYSVIATVHGSTEQQARHRQRLILATLTKDASHD